MTTLPARPFALDQFDKSSILDIILRHYTHLNLSLTHAFLCIILCPLALFIHAPDWDIPAWFQGPDGYLHRGTPLGNSLVFLMSVIYYIWDTTCIFRICRMVSNGKLRFDDYGYLFHHLSCGLGMLFPAVLGVDGPLVLFAFILGEISNPPRGIAETLEFEMDAMRQFAQKVTKAELEKAKLTMDDLQRRFSSVFDSYLLCLDIHFYSFCILRLVLTWYTFFVVLPYAKLTLTFIAALFMTLFSVGSVFILVPERIERNSKLNELRLLVPADKKVE